MTTQTDIDERIARMTLRERIGQVIMAVHAPSWQRPPDTETLIREHHVGSVISCGYRTSTPTEVVRWNNRLQTVAMESGGVPLLNGGDFEQGVASQVPIGTTPFPMQMGIAAAGSTADAEKAAEIAGREARALGFHWTFAPICDVNSNPSNPVIGVRTFSDDTQTVIELTRAQLRGYQRAGMVPTPKHFPGHGDAATDSHLDLPVISCPADEYRAVHLAPFVDAIAEGAPTLMTAHVVVQAIDTELPATLSRRVLTGLLREELGYEGLVITDQLTMKSVANRWGMAKGSVMAFQAGADIVMAGGDTEEQLSVISAMVDAAESGAIDSARLEQSVRRVLALKEACGLFNQPLVEASGVQQVGTEESLGFAQGLADRSITLVKNENVLPFSPDAEGRVLIAGVTAQSVFGPTRASHVAYVGDTIKEIASGEVVAWTAGSEDPTDEEIEEVCAMASAADRIVALTYARGALPEGQARMVRRLSALGRPLVAVALGTPYDVVAYPDVGAYVAAFTHSFVPVHISAPNVVKALSRVLYGLPPHGRLPVQIPGLYDRGHGLGF